MSEETLVLIKKLETDEDRHSVLRLHIALNYLGKKCELCNFLFESVDEFLERNPVGCGKDNIACKKCFEDKYGKRK